MKCREQWAHPTEPDILITSFLDSSFLTTQERWEQGKGEKNLTTENSLSKVHINNAMFMAYWITLLLQGSFLRCINLLQNSFPRSIVTHLQV